MEAIDFVNLLNGREYRNEITKEEEIQAKESGLVIVFGYSDDNIEFSGAINDEVGAYNGTTIFFDKDGIMANKCLEGDSCPYFEKFKKTAKTIEAKWNENGYSWYLETEIPHKSFDIMEDGEKYCRGIVFNINELKKG